MKKDVSFRIAYTPDIHFRITIMDLLWTITVIGLMNSGKHK